MADSKKNKPGAATEPVDVSQVDQESTVTKPTRTDMPTRQFATQGYAIPEHFHALEDAGGDLEKAGEILRTSSTAPLHQDEVNAQADEIQREAMSRAGREYHVPGQKSATGPSENKRAADPAANKEPGQAEDYSGHLKADLESEAEKRGLEVKGTGADGAVLVEDLRKALVKDDRAKARG